MTVAAVALLLFALQAPHKTPFAAGVVSGPAGADAATFSPDGNLVVFDSPPTETKSTLMIARRVHGIWTKPVVAPFSGKWYDQDPAMAPDGSYIVFVSNRPRPGAAAAPHTADLWRVDRHNESWGAPVWLPATINSGEHHYAPSVASDGSIYFTRDNQDRVCIFRNRAFHSAQLVHVPGMAQIGDPVIAPDQTYLVFTALKDGRSDLYLSLRSGRGWGAPRDLHTSDDGDSNWDPHLGPGSRLYFSSQRHGVTGVWSIPLTLTLLNAEDW